MPTASSTQQFDLSESDVKEAVAEYIERKYGAGNELSVSVSVRTTTTGYGMQETDSHVVSVTASRKLGPKVDLKTYVVDYAGLSAEMKQRIRDACPPCRTGDCEDPHHQ